MTPLAVSFNSPCSKYAIQYLLQYGIQCYSSCMSEADKHLSAEELDAIILILEDELAIAEQQPGASWYKATL